MKKHPVAVCMVHGLWMKGHEMALFGNRLEKMGFQPARFSYPSRSESLAENAGRLARFLESAGLRHCSFVCHSYGGLVVYKYLEKFQVDKPVRVVFLGSPVNGSSLARKLGGLKLVQFLAGRSLPALERGCDKAPSGHHCAMIAGSLNIGMGMFFLDGPADGMVAVSDTRAGWLEKHVVIRCSHLALLFSGKAARECGKFFLEDYGG